MQHVLTLFDYTKTPPLPLQSVVIGDSVRFYTFYLLDTGIKVREIEEQVKQFRELFEQTTCVNDFKAHVAAFNLDKHVEYDVYDMNLPPIRIAPRGELHGKKLLAKIAAEYMKLEPSPWNQLLANASVVYQHLEELGVRNGHKRMPVHYSLETTSGRSKTLGYNVQGTTAQENVRSTRDENTVLVHFDWVAADLCMAANMSGDEAMLDSFKESDPYMAIANHLNSPEFDRAACKGMFLKAFYSLNTNSPIFDVFPTFKEWMLDRVNFMRRHGYVESIMGRRFRGENELSVFNSQFQGSVAHAMQATLRGLFYGCGSNFVAEIHDSLVMSAPATEVGSLISRVVPVMISPFEGWLETPPRMPLKVSVGSSWKQWKRLREYR
jgi:hypothetical protein